MDKCSGVAQEQMHCKPGGLTTPQAENNVLW